MLYDLPVSQICALMVFSSMDSVLVANSTPMVDLESRLNSLRVNLDRTVWMKWLRSAAIGWPFSTYDFCQEGWSLVSMFACSSSEL